MLLVAVIASAFLPSKGDLIELGVDSALWWMAPEESAAVEAKVGEVATQLDVTDRWDTNEWVDGIHVWFEEEAKTRRVRQNLADSWAAENYNASFITEDSMAALTDEERIEFINEIGGNNLEVTWVEVQTYRCDSVPQLPDEAWMLEAWNVTNCESWHRRVALEQGQ